MCHICDEHSHAGGVGGPEQEDLHHADCPFSPDQEMLLMQGDRAGKLLLVWPPISTTSRFGSPGCPSVITVFLLRSPAHNFHDGEW
jgi:hypothetical protein